VRPDRFVAAVFAPERAGAVAADLVRRLDVPPPAAAPAVVDAIADNPIRSTPA
jgi:hypothetical protein